MVTQRQRLAEAAGKRLEPAEMGDPLLVRQTAKADPLRPALIAPALDMRREARRFHGIKESLAQFLVVAGGGKAVLNRFGHGPLNLPNHGSLYSNRYGGDRHEQQHAARRNGRMPALYT
jgi:hypothetical protein